MSVGQLNFADWLKNRGDSKAEEGNEAYNDFVEKFKPKKTTDDCYTPENIYNAVADWVANEYGRDREKFVRPFWPGGDYEREEYPEGCTVVDNPPFSILAQICRFYMARGIGFFLFAPALTLFSADRKGMTSICAGASITYENGAVVRTAFKTNLEPETACRTAPDLRAALDAIDKENTRSDGSMLKYAYPPHIVTAAKVQRWSELGVEWKLPRREAIKISALDAMREKSKCIFGGGYLISAAQAAKAAKAAQAAQAAKAAKAAGADPEDINEDGAIVWRLSEREQRIVGALRQKEAVE